MAVVGWLMNHKKRLVHALLAVLLACGAILSFFPESGFGKALQGAIDVVTRVDGQLPADPAQ